MLGGERERKHTLEELIGRRMVVSTPTHVTVGLLESVDEMYLVVTNLIRFTSDEAPRRREFVELMASVKAHRPTHQRVLLFIHSIHAVLVPDSVNADALESFGHWIHNEIPIRQRPSRP